MSQRFHQKRHVSRDTYVPDINIIILTCLYCIYMCNHIYIYISHRVLSVNFSSDGPRHCNHLSGAITKALHSSRRETLRCGAVWRISKQRSQQPMATKIWPNFVQMIHFKLNFMLILGHPERQRGCHESAPGVWGKCYRKRRGCPELPQNVTGPVGDSTLKYSCCSLG